jgi:hypothetical protein
MPTVLGEGWSTKLALHDPDQGVDDEEEHHLYRATIGEGNALAVEVNLFRHTYNTLQPHQERTPRAAYLAVERCD